MTLDQAHKALLQTSEVEYLSLSTLDKELPWVRRIYHKGKINNHIFIGLLLYASDEEMKTIRERWEKKETNDNKLFNELEKLARVKSLAEE